jgi:CheY-like chemotaxis protein
MDKIQKALKFADFLNKSEVLIVDKSSASRRRLAKTLSELGGKMINIQMCSNYEEAQKLMVERKPMLVLSDYAIIGGSGFDLFEYYRKEVEGADKATLVLVTSNSSQSAVAKAAEEDVDAFIIKPYTVETLSMGIINAYITKNHPTKYIQLIEEGKILLFSGDVDEAIKIFTKAIKLSKSPSLALFYIGQSRNVQKELTSAEGKFKEGLTYNHIHYKCQIGLFDMYYSQDKHEDAYDIVKNIAKFFPANPDRLQTIVRLAIVTENYSDMEYYYEIFTALDMRSNDTIKYICAGLYVAGKYLFNIGDSNKGIDYFKKITISAEGKTKFLRAMIEVLVDKGFAQEAQDIMGRFEDDTKTGNDFYISKFLVLSTSAETADFLSEGISLFNKKIINFTAYKIFLKGLKEKGYTDKYEEYLKEALIAFPEREKTLNGI